MSLAIITLPTNKSISTVSDHVRKIGQGEKGQKLSVIVTDANGSGYDLTEKSLTFSENKEGGKIVSDNDSSHFSITDASAGRFDYTLAPAVYAASGTAWFDITSADGSVIDTTKNFDIKVIEDEGIHINNDNYVSNLSAFETHYEAVIQKSKQDSEALMTKINSDLSQALADNNKKAADALTGQKAKLQTVIDAATKLESDWNDQFTKQKQSLTDVDAAWQAQTKKIQDAADAQVKSIQDSADADKNTAIQAVNDARDKAISDANTKFADQRTSILTDYNNWKKTAVGDFQSQINKLGQELKTDEDDQASLETAIDSAKEAVSKIQDVDFTLFAHKSDLDNYYTKSEIDPMIAQAGKVKTVQKIAPDGNGDIEVPVIKEFSTPQEAYDKSKNGNFVAVYDPDDGPTSAIIGDKVVTISTLNDAINSLQSTVSGVSSSVSSLNNTVNGKANQSDLDKLNQTVSANGITLGQLKTAISNLASSDTIKTIQGDITNLQSQVSSLSGTVSSKADSSSVSTLQDQITANKNSVTSLNTTLNSYSKKPIKAANQADAIAKSKDGNWYYW